MAGCFGSDLEDRIKENELLNYLDDDFEIDTCEECNKELSEDELLHGCLDCLLELDLEEGEEYE